MSSITTDKGILHYEVHGRGQPVILLHGWLGSWGLWQETMTYLGQYYRTYALDFWGFGESGRKLDSYQVSDFVDLVIQFMDQMGISNSPLIGHSMGGTVSLLSALSFPDRISKVVIIGSPITGSSLALPLKIAGYKPIASLLFRFFGLFRKIMRWMSPIICQDPRFPDMMDRDLSRTTFNSFLISINSLQKTDLRDELNNAGFPVLGIFGKRDNIVSPDQRKVLIASISSAKIKWFPNAGHFIMLDEPSKFMKTIKQFLENESDNETQ
jgi:pimeloyl-ACP methyl ester carboxylesterase